MTPLCPLGVLAVGTEEPQLVYRVRLRVAEENDVALLAESSEERKARAEADIRGRGEFEVVQESWPVSGSRSMQRWYMEPPFRRLVQTMNWC